MTVAIVSDGNSLDNLHYKIRPPRIGCSAVKHFGNAGMVHQSQHLTLGFETAGYLLGIHAQLDDL